jgi:outer membrane receptor protein involved in Fe transport
MNNFFKRSGLSTAFFLLTATIGFSQTNISGTVTDATGEPLAGVNILVKGRVIGTITDTKGDYQLTVNDPPPLTLIFSFIGFGTQEMQVTDANTTNLTVQLNEQTILGHEIVVSASRVEESILQSPVTIEKVDLLSIQQTPAPEFYEALANVKGVQVSSGSLNFPAINTRGFATIANVRFVQLVDGMDVSAPLLNFPTGNIIGLGELDAESMELVPGAASALYGPNAFNGILIMKSKSPFEFQGLSAQVKGGVTTSDAQGEANPFFQYGIRYAKAFNNKFAFKVNFSYLDAQDWIGNDYRTSRVLPDSQTDLSGTENFDGLNLYGDETQISTGVPSIGIITRTGFKEEDILDNQDAKSIKGDVALHYRITDKIEAIYNYRYGGGSSIYQGAEKYALRNFTQQFHKAELRAENFFLRAYLNQTDAGDSYNLSALGAYMNEEYNPSIRPDGSGWVPEYVLAMQGYFTGLGVPGGNPDAARSFADRNRPAPGTPAFAALADKVRSQFFQRTPPGASFIDDSKVYMAEFNYNFMNQIEVVEIQLGGNVRRYDLFSDGTIFNEGPEDKNFERLKIDEYGVYTQISKTFAESLKLTGSLRYDKNENFEGQITPRFSAVYTFNQSHNIRGSFQTGFRNPDTQAQFIYFPSSGGTLLGSTEANASRYGVHNGGSWTQASYNAFRAAGGSLDPVTGDPGGADPALLVTADIPYVQPEKLSSFEVGYKGIFSNQVLLDVNYYYSMYTDFIGGDIVASKEVTSHQGNTLDPGTLFSLYSNSPQDITSQGIGVGITYNLPRYYTFSANYNYATFDVKGEVAENFTSNFNTPENKFNVGLSNRKVFQNLGFSVNFRWQESFLWESSYGRWDVPEFGVFDAQVSYKIPTIKTMVKIGGTNLFGSDYRTNLGAPFVGQQYYMSLTFDQFFK